MGVPAPVWSFSQLPTPWCDAHLQRCSIAQYVMPRWEGGPVPVPLYQRKADFFRTLAHAVRIRVLELVRRTEAGGGAMTPGRMASVGVPVRRACRRVGIGGPALAERTPSTTIVPAAGLDSTGWVCAVKAMATGLAQRKAWETCSAVTNSPLPLLSADRDDGDDAVGARLDAIAVQMHRYAPLWSEQGTCCGPPGQRDPAAPQRRPSRTGRGAAAGRGQAVSPLGLTAYGASR